MIARATSPTGSRVQDYQDLRFDGELLANIVRADEYHPYGVPN